jgi:acyl-CoA synthetase (AMP-forming)/AMP-acid ligase II
MRLHDVLDYRARERPDREFATCGGRTISFGNALGVSRNISNALSTSLARGDRIAVISRNSIEFALIYFGASRAGVVVVPLNYRLTPDDWMYAICDSGAKILLIEDHYLDLVEGIRSNLHTVEKLIVLNSQRAHVHDSFDDWIESAADAGERNVSGDDIVYQMYTSGTTGRPKGVLLSHNAVTSSIFQRTLALRCSPDDRCLVVAPIFHAAGATMMFWAISGGGCVYLHEAFDPKAVVETLSKEGIARTTLVPAMLQSCLNLSDIESYRFGNLKLVSYGGSAISEKTLKRAIEIFGCDFAQGYGLTEATGNVTGLLPSDHVRALQERPSLLLSAGRPLPGTEIRVVDPDGRPVPANTPGEITVRGPQLMAGYHKLDAATAATIKDGWLQTGDVGYFDDEGYLYLSDRIKDVIVSGGENIYPRTIENALAEHPAIFEAAAIGVPDQRWGETVKAIVVLRDGHTATEEELISFARGKLGGMQRPRSVEFVAALPKSGSGKVLKTELRKAYWGERGRRIGEI